MTVTGWLGSTQDKYDWEIRQPQVRDLWVELEHPSPLGGYLTTPSDPEDIHQTDLVAGEEVPPDDPDGSPTHIEDDPEEGT